MELSKGQNEWDTDESKTLNIKGKAAPNLELAGGERDLGADGAAASGHVWLEPRLGPGEGEEQEVKLEGRKSCMLSCNLI